MAATGLLTSSTSRRRATTRRYRDRSLHRGHATAEIVALGLPLLGLLNNPNITQMHVATKNALGWDMTYATNHLGPFVLTEALVPHLPDGANVVFVASAVEDPERKPAARFGFRGARHISVEANARGEWKPGDFDEGGEPMLGSTQVRDPAFQDRVVAETRALLATVAA